MTDPMPVETRIQIDLVRFIADVVLFNQVVSQRVGLSGSDSQFMTLLQVHGPLTPGELASRSGLTTGTVTGVLDRLERAGFVRRSRDPHDRRKVIVSQDEQALAERLYPHYAGQARLLARVLESRSERDLEVIASFLSDMLSSTDDQGPTGADGG